MGKRGKKSSSELATVVIDAGRRMPAPPPAELTDAQATIWRDVVAALPGHWFDTASKPVLVEFCRHVGRARLLERLVAKFEAEWISVEGGVERLDKLLAMAERETRAVLACGRALRLTPQARVDPKTAGRAARDAGTGRKPWD